jgi:hypothetical protein
MANVALDREMDGVHDDVGAVWPGVHSLGLGNFSILVELA